jgi:hypothetical protein
MALGNMKALFSLHQKDGALGSFSHSLPGEKYWEGHIKVIRRLLTKANTREIRLRSTGLAAQDGILRAGWQPFRHF